MSGGWRAELDGYTRALAGAFIFGIPLVSAQQGPFQDPIGETELSYVVSLAIAFVALVLFDQLGAADPVHEMVTETIVLGFPATIGGAASRALI